MLYFFLEKFYLSCTYFGCYLHPSSGAQLQFTAIGFFYLWENRSFSIKWCAGLFYVDLCVLVFLISCDIYVLVCVIESVLVLRGFDV
jgi:hypothetical protein